MNTNEPLRPEDIAVGSLTFAKPEGLEEHDEDFQSEIAKAALMIVRIQPEDIKDKRELDWSHEGIVAYSKICTHVGCPISLYEQQTHHVLCPCHQSTFDLSDGARVIFGPAGHALPQLRIGVNDEGFLEALGDFEEPVGPCLLGARMSNERPRPPTRRGARRPPASGSPTGPTAGWASTAWPRPTCARSSRTTGPSCWVRSASTASSSSSSRVSI